MNRRPLREILRRELKELDREDELRFAVEIGRMEGWSAWPDREDCSRWLDRRLRSGAKTGKRMADLDWAGVFIDMFGSSDLTGDILRRAAEADVRIAREREMKRAMRKVASNRGKRAVG